MSESNLSSTDRIKKNSDSLEATRRDFMKGAAATVVAGGLAPSLMGGMVSAEGSDVIRVGLSIFFTGISKTFPVSGHIGKNGL